MHEHSLKGSIVWLLKQFEGLDPTCKLFLLSRNRNKGAKEISMEERKKKARERAMNAMKASANKFASHVNEEKGMARDNEIDQQAAGDLGGGLDAKKGQESDAVMGEDAADGSMAAVNTTVSVRKRRIKDGDSYIDGNSNGIEDEDEDEEETDEEDSCDSAVCIVCQVRGEQEPSGPGQNKNQGQGQGTGSFGQRKIGYIAFSQFSRAWNSKVQFQSGMRLADDIESPLSSNMMDGDVHLSFCGHGKRTTYLV